ncbi:cupin domain-containing protein [Mobilicoccus caccae]|uniref:Transcription regulator n=1 Tax=Mobilicoccus caccae TaxID=1859295 RepID=A0ABQ6IUJ4_9MICO|nr:cupin domain-containing protein [Mobilicoccus caccae]GMA40963.1 transcription regulator [Mobilicoccus caccae]
MKSLPVQGAREVVQVGARLRSARQERRYTLDQVAQLSGMTKGFLSRVERDLTSPSVASLVTLCQVLKIEIGSLFASPRISLVRLADSLPVDLGGVGMEERLVTGRDERSVQLLRGVMQPGAHGEEELYSLDCETEVWHVVDGRIEVRLNEDTHVLETGDTLTFPGREPHTWRNLAEGESVVLFVLLPYAGSGGVRLA